MNSGENRISEDVMEKFFEVFKVATSKVRKILDSRDLNPQSLMDLTSTELAHLFQMESTIRGLFEEDMDLLRVCSSIPQYQDLMDMIRQASIKKQVLDSLTQLHKEEIMDEIKLQIPGESTSFLNLKSVLEECLPSRITILSIKKNHPATKVKSLVDKLLMSDSALQLVNDDIKLSILEKSPFYPLYCRRFLEEEVGESFSQDVRLSNREARVLGDDQNRTQLVTNIGINPEDCKLKEGSVLTTKTNKLSKIFLEVGSTDVKKAISLSSGIKIINSLKIKDFLSSI